MASETQGMKPFSLYEAYGLHEIFVAENKDAEIHFEIALDAPLPKIIERMDGLKEKCKGILNMHYSDLNLTALHFGVLKNNLELVTELLSRGARPDLTDKFGFTPWLHTALLTEGLKMRTLLESKGYKPAKKDIRQWNHLQQRAGLQQVELPSDRISFKGKKGAPVSLSASIVQQQLKLKDYTDLPLCFPSEYHYLWQNFFSKKPSVDTESVFFLDVEKQLLEGKLPHLRVAHHPLVGQRDIGLSLFAQSAIQPGQPIDWLGGTVQKTEVFHIESIDDHWLLFERLVKENNHEAEVSIGIRSGLELNSFHRGNAITCSNDGLPVVAVEALQNGRMAMFATEKIEPGTEITWDRGPGCRNMKWGDYILVKRDELVNYYKEHPSFIQLYRDGRASVEKLAELDSGKKMLHRLIQSSYLDVIPVRLKMNYIYNTPAALVYLGIQDLISAEECFILLQSPDVKDFTNMGNYPCHFIWVLTVLSVLKQVQEQTKRLSEEQKKQLATYFIQDIFEKVSVTQAVKGLLILSGYLERNQLKEFLGQSWTRRLKSYDFQQDPSCVFPRYDSELGLIIRKGIYEMIGKIPYLAHFIARVNKKEVVDVQEVK